MLRQDILSYSIHLFLGKFSPCYWQCHSYLLQHAMVENIKKLALVKYTALENSHFLGTILLGCTDVEKRLKTNRRFS